MRQAKAKTKAGSNCPGSVILATYLMVAVSVLQTRVRAFNAVCVSSFKSSHG